MTIIGGSYLNKITGNTAAAAANAAELVTLGGRVKWGNAANLTELRTLDKTKVSYCRTEGYTSAGDGGGAFYYLDAADTTTADDGFLCIVATDGARWKLNHNGRVNVRCAGAVGDGVTDDVAAFQKAFDSFSAVGGGVVYYDDGTYLLDSTLEVQDYCYLVGPHLSPDPRRASKLVQMSGRLLLNPLARINLNESSGLKGVIITPKGMTFPQIDTEIATWTGTAVYASALKHGQYVGYCNIVGFDTAIETDAATNTEQLRIEYLNFDCLNGIKMVQIYDSAYVDHCHGWPAASTDARAGVPTANDLNRSGVAYSVSAVGDWNKITNSFCYGYATGYQISSANSVSLISCGADSTNDRATTGFLIDGTSNNTKLIGCQAAGHQYGYRINTADGAAANLTDCAAWGSNGTHNVLIDGGDVQLNGGYYRNGVNGITINNSASEIQIDGVSLNNHSNQPIRFAVANAKTRIINPKPYGLAAGVNVSAGPGSAVNTVASADPFNLPAGNDVIHISGVTSFGTLQGGYEGQIVTFIFDGALTVFDSATLKLAGDFITTADAVLRIIKSGGVWYEISRSTN